MANRLKEIFCPSIVKRRLGGKRLLVSFPNAVDARVGVEELPKAGSFWIGVVPSKSPEAKEGEHAVAIEAIGGERREIARFRTQLEAAEALRKLQRKLSRSAWACVKGIVGWASTALVVAGVISLTMAPSPRQAQRGAAPAMGTGANGLPAGMTQEQAMELARQLAGQRGGQIGAQMQAQSQAEAQQRQDAYLQQQQQQQPIGQEADAATEAGANLIDRLGGAR